MKDREWHELMTAQSKAAESYRRYVLGQMRAARLRIQFHLDQIDAIGMMLKSRKIEPDDAVALVEEIGGYLLPSAPPEAEETKVESS